MFINRTCQTQLQKIQVSSGSGLLSHRRLGTLLFNLGFPTDASRRGPVFQQGHKSPNPGPFHSGRVPFGVQSVPSARSHVLASLSKPHLSKSVASQPGKEGGRRAGRLGPWRQKKKGGRRGWLGEGERKLPHKQSAAP